MTPVPLRPNAASRREAGRGARSAWCFFDFANSAFTTLVVTFIYATWFTKVMAPDEVIGTQRWSWGITSSALLVALCAPLLGAFADRHGRRKTVFVWTTALCIAATVALAFVTPPHWITALLVFMVANTSYEISLAFYNSFLPGLSSTERVGRLSGIAWALGYGGGLLCLVAGFLFTGLPGVIDPVLPTANGFNIRATNLLVAAWFLVFGLPALILLPEAPLADRKVTTGFRALARSFRTLTRLRQAFRLLLARLVYNDGIVTIFAFGGIYAAGTFGMSLAEIIQFGIALNLAAGLGAWLFSPLDDWLGGKTVILISLVGLIGASLMAALAPTRAWFWAAGILIGLLVGPNQSASRSLMARFVPPSQTSQLFGLYAFSGKLTSFAGPLFLGWLTSLAQSQRVGVSSVILFFVAGGAILLSVDEEQGRSEAL